jgi:hypothetical protein
LEVVLVLGCGAEDRLHCKHCCIPRMHQEGNEYSINGKTERMVVTQSVD